MDPTVHGVYLLPETISSLSQWFSLGSLHTHPRLPRQKEVRVGKGEGQLSWELRHVPQSLPGHGTPALSIGQSGSSSLLL